MNRRYYVCKNLTHAIISSLRLIAFILMVVKDSFAERSSSCDREYISGGNAESKGEFSTPEWPLMYPSNTRCRLKFRAKENEVVWITWDEFHLEDPMPDINQCLRDYVEVIVIDYHNQHHVAGRYCGEKLPPDFKTMQAAVDIIFQSSFTKHYKGFSGSFQFISEKEVQPPMSVSSSGNNCGGFAQGKFGGEITNPGYPDSYPESVECNWVIRVNPGKQIYINLLELELTESIAECNNAKVLVIDGYAHVSPGKRASDILSPEQFVEFCGEEDYLKDEGQKSYMSEKNRMLVKFTTTKPPSEGVLNKRKRFGKPVGFRLVWTEVSVMDPKEENTCSDFYCRGGQYCIEDMHSVCVMRKRYCIDKSLVCDGMPNCAESDNSDEENCYSYEIVGAGASVFCFLVLVILLVICCQRRRNRKHLLRMRDTDTTSAAQLPQQETRNSVLNNRHRGNSGPIRASDSNELKALPMNYHGYKEEESQEPFLAHNHVSHNPPPPQHPPSFHYVMSPEEAESPSFFRDPRPRKTPKGDGDVWTDGYRSGETEDIWQHRRFLTPDSGGGRKSEWDRSGLQPPSPVVEFHPEPERRWEDSSLTSPSDESSSVRNRRAPPVPLKPILKTSVTGPHPNVSGFKPKRKDAREGDHSSTKTAPAPPPRVDSRSSYGMSDEAQRFTGLVYAKPGKTVGFAPIPSEPSGSVQRTPIPPPLKIPSSISDEGQGDDRSPSPWHHRTKPTEV